MGFGGVRCGLIGSGGVISHTGMSKISSMANVPNWYSGRAEGL